MNKSAKGAVAAAAAGVLLLGGAGSLAYWSDSDGVAGGTFNSGSLSLTALNTCNAWTIDSDEDAPGATFDPLSDLLVPGDKITKECTFTVDATGDHLRATVAAAATTDSGVLAPNLTLDPAALTIGGTTVTEITEANDGDTLTVTVGVTFDSTSDNTTQLKSGTLDEIAITTSQVHD